MKEYQINIGKIDFHTIESIINSKAKLVLSDTAKDAIIACRTYLDKKMASQKEPIYGINTGFGSLCNTIISNDDLGKLQKNLVMSHACGMGEEVPQEIVKLMLLLKVQSLSYGKSAVQLDTVERLIFFYNNNIIPVVYQQGSLGASGDLAPLANLCLPLIGLGEVYFEGKKQTTQEVYKKLNLNTIDLKSKEGLALLNGTQFMSAFGVFILLKSFKYSNFADIIAAASLDGFDGRIEPFSDLVHQIRPHNGQIKTADNFRKLLNGSQIIKRYKEHVQDPYSFRCIPQVHGASKDAINYVASVFLTEINSVTDNPTVFPEDDTIISAGNFHGQPLALALDFLSIALAELGSISERRVYKLISGQRGLPPFLVANPGLNSGFMIPQYAVASIVSQNKQLASPASIDTIDSSNGQEDHVSMGANAATKTYRILLNLEKILGVELFNAAQALDFRTPQKSSRKIQKLISDFRKEVPFVKEDIVMYTQMAKAACFVANYSIEGVL